MKICQTEQEFIDYVAPIAQKVCKRYGFKPSILIAQTFHENGAAVPSNFDNDGIYDLMKYNCMVGQKAELLNETWSDYTVWGGEKFYKLTPEEYNGKMVTISDAFRKFDSVEQSFADYILFLLYAKDSVNAKDYRYGAKVVNIDDPEALITAVGKKYATGSSYAKNCMAIVRKYNLTRFDDLTNVEPSMIVPDSLKLKYGLSGTTAHTTETTADTTETIHIIDRTRYNTPPRWGNTREALVFHFLGVKAADNPDLYDGGYGGQWYISRKGEIYHSVKEGGTVWAVGSGGWGLKTTEWNNSNTESVEMGCENDNGSNDIYDKKWWFHMVTQEAAVKLARYWLENRGYGVSEASVNKRILIHNSITNKPCPAPWLHGANYQSPNEKGHRNWTFNEFKRKIWEGYSGSTVTGDEPSGLSKGDTGTAVKTMQSMLISCGYSCGTAGADGDFGTKTLGALKAFQMDKNLSVTGIYDDKTKAALEAAYKAVSKKTDEKSTDKTTETASDTVYNGVDYKYVYNYTYYRKKYADLRLAFGKDKAKYFEHFCIFGMKEGRKASSNFSVQAYQKRYADLRNAFGDNLPLYYWHYCVYGRKENRKTT